MTTRELKQKYLEFFQKKDHKIIAGASLIPENDSTVLFTTAGMHPLVPFLLGEKHPAGQRLCNVQKCIRTSDIDEVGDDFHLTFFEMLGNWSLGDYFKQEAIAWSWEFLTDKQWLGLEKERLSFSCFEGQGNIPKDEESAKIWESLGVNKGKIRFLDKDNNWWDSPGKTGPCGPDTEMFFDGIEIWNDVFMEYNKNEKGEYEPLSQKNVDTGMGVERTTAILNGVKSVYEIEPLKTLIKKVEELSSSLDEKAERIIADHLRAAVFILGDDKAIRPSNVEQGYVLRRLIRRAIRYAKKIGINDLFTQKIGQIVIDLMKDEYPELEKNREFIIDQLNQEEERFSRTLEKGLKEFEKISDKNISGYDAFVLFATYGFPIEITKELAREKGIEVDENGFEQEFEKHKDLSRTAAAGKFKSGLADNSEQVTRLHTAAHLLLASLRIVLGEHVFQKGSNITAERLRLDFSHSEKMSPEQIKQVEDLVNEKIEKELLVNCEEMFLNEAKESGAMGVFDSKYGERVKVYSVIDSGKVFSKEICSGPHVSNTKELGKFKIQKEESVASGVRRIKAILTD